MPIACPSCGARIPAEDVDLSTKLAKCVECDEVFSIDAQLGAPPVPLATGPRLPRVPPRGITFERDVPKEDDRPTAFRELARARDPGRFVLRRRWLSPMHFGLLFFCIAWDSFLVFWYGIAFSTDAPWIMKVFPIAHVAVGVGLTYSVLAGFLNRTTVRIEEGRLEVRHGPLPWVGNTSLEVAGLRSVYVTSKTTTSSQGRATVKQAVVADTDAAAEVSLLELEDSTQAEFVAAAVAEHLGLPNRALPG